jgi:hypothetical protein
MTQTEEITQPFFIITYIIFYFIQLAKVVAPFFIEKWEDFVTFFTINNATFDPDREESTPSHSPEKTFFDRALKRFDTYDKTAHCIVNENVESLYYDKKEYTRIFADEKNPHETRWKTKILYVTTPRGNIAMFYNPYKLGFAYYSDQSAISYEILNAVAMKYVITYKCLDFFMDEKYFVSSLIQIHFTEDKSKKMSDATDSESSSSETDYSVKIEYGDKGPSPFAKLKKYEETSTKSVFVTASATSKKDPFDDLLDKEIIGFLEPVKPVIPPPAPQKKETNKNKFLYMGKLSNFNFTQPLPKMRRQLKPFKSVLIDTVEENAETQRARFSYRDFKLLSTKESNQVFL